MENQITMLRFNLFNLDDGVPQSICMGWHPRDGLGGVRGVCARDGEQRRRLAHMDPCGSPRHPHSTTREELVYKSISHISMVTTSLLTFPLCTKVTFQ